MARITLVAIVLTILALLQFLLFSFLVGRARGQYKIKAPACTGHEVFERYFRVHMNTMELLVMLLPLLWIAAAFRLVADYWLALLGIVYLIGRFIYLRSYVADPARRSAGFGMSSLPVLILFVIDIIGAIHLWLVSNAS
jgi:glutathione S-transferase